MTKPDVTIVVVPRERFSYTRSLLQGVYANTDMPFELVYVDGDSPPPIRDWLATQATERDFTLLRSDGDLTPNRSRNLGFARVRTKYTVFLDNDVAVSPGWLRPLVECAEEIAAEVVGPLYCIDEPLPRKVHMAGGLAHFAEREGRRRFVEKHLHVWWWLADVRPPPSARSDLPFYLLRWRHALAQAGLERLRRKWKLEEDDPYLVRRRRWIASHRVRVVLPLWRALTRAGDEHRYLWAPAPSRQLDRLAGPAALRPQHELLAAPPP